MQIYSLVLFNNLCLPNKIKKKAETTFLWDKMQIHGFLGGRMWDGETIIEKQETRDKRQENRE